MNLSSNDQSRRIAVVEESADNIYSMRFILQSLGYEVTSVIPSSQFLNELEKFSPSVVIVDMLISGEVGMAVIKGIRESSLRSVGIVAVTADAVPFGVEEIRDAGANSVLVKPYTVAELQEALEDFLQ